jgi:galactokinase
MAISGEFGRKGRYEAAMSTQVWFAPGRANLMGEHTDYNGGFVLPFALAQGVTATATARADGLLVLRSKQKPGDPVTIALDALAPGAVTGSAAGWAAYPAGVAWALGDAGFDIVGASIDIDSDLPVGAGVSSSAALECAVALALCSLSGLSVPREQLALIAKRAENEFVGAPTGIIDQSAALLCQEGHAMLLDCGTLARTQVPFRPSAAGAVALIVDTRVTHALVSGEYAARRAECEEAARLLGVPALGAVTDADAVEVLADPVLRRRARHVISDSARARTIASALQREGEVGEGRHAGGEGRGGGEVGEGRRAGGEGGGRGGNSTDAYRAETYRYVGTLLTEGHVSLRDDFEVSWPQADATVDVAIGAGAYGAKMIGGGFGGSVLALIPGEREATVRSLLSETFQERGWAAPEYLDAVPSPAARRRGDQVQPGFQTERFS